MITAQFSLDINEEMIVDNFAGGGGASTGIERALGRHVDIAVNHDREAVALHKANHPQTEHHCEDVFKIRPEEVTKGRKVGLAWFSPDCKHFSKAKGGKPRSKKIRGLAWVVVKWAAIVRPRVIILENVEEFQNWGPLLEDGSPCPQRKGKTFRAFIRRLQELGYTVDWRELRACDYGAPTIRKRLFLIARCDGRPSIWPVPTHANPQSPGFKKSGLKPWRTAAECIDWSIPCHSIFLIKAEAKKVRVKRPLAEATMRRLARGVKKFVIDAKEPFIVNFTHQGGDRNESTGEPFRVITAARRGEKGLVIPTLIQTGYGERKGQLPRVPGLDKPLGTTVSSGKHALVEAFLSKYNSSHSGKSDGDKRNHSLKEPLRTQDTSNRHAIAAVNLMVNTTGHSGSSAKEPIKTVTGGGEQFLVASHLAKHFTGVTGTPLDKPLSTVTTVDHHSLCASHLSKLYGTTTGQSNNEPLHTITGGGNHIAEVRAFLIKYYGNEKDGCALDEPIHTIPTVDRFGLVTIAQTLYQIIDICIRMLVPRELYRGQGFPESYIINVQIGWKKRKGARVPNYLSQEAQVRMCGNSVSPVMAEALAAVNVPELAIWRNGEMKQFKGRHAALTRPVAMAA